MLRTGLFEVFRVIFPDVAFHGLVVKLGAIIIGPLKTGLGLGAVGISMSKFCSRSVNSLLEYCSLAVFPILLSPPLMKFS